MGAMTMIYAKKWEQRLRIEAASACWLGKGSIGSGV